MEEKQFNCLNEILDYKKEMDIELKVLHKYNLNKEKQDILQKNIKMINDRKEKTNMCLVIGDHNNLQELFCYSFFEENN